MANLNKRFLDALVVTQGREIHWDSGLKGFGVLAMASGVRSFVFDYRNADGRKRRVTIGRFGALTVEQARQEARALAGRVAKGEDPAAARSARRAAPTVADLFDDYLSRHADVENAPRTRASARGLVEKHLKPALGALKAASVTRQDMLRLRKRMEATPRQANLALAVASKAFSLAEEWGWRPQNSNPCARVPRFEENDRERFLSRDELARLGSAIEEAETVGLPWQEREGAKAKHRPKPDNRRTIVNAQALVVIRLLLLTGARVSEFLELKWAHVDFERGTVELPGRKGGTRRAHPVSSAALVILASVTRQEGSEWVFTAPQDATAHLPISVLQNAWQRLRAAAGIEDVRLHDLRHTAGTFVSQGGLNAFGVRDFLRHKSIAMTGRYANQDADPIREAAEGLAERVAAGLAGASGGEVVRFPVARAPKTSK